MEHSTFRLLLNPPSDIRFQYIFRDSLYFKGNVAHFFPLHSLHLDLTFWAVPILLTFYPSEGKLATVVYRRDEQGRVRLNGDYRF